MVVLWGSVLIDCNLYFLASIDNFLAWSGSLVAESDELSDMEELMHEQESLLSDRKVVFLYHPSPLSVDKFSLCQLILK